MKRREIRFSDLENEYINIYLRNKEYTLNGLVRYALKRYLTTNPLKGIEMPDSLKAEVIHKK